VGHLQDVGRLQDVGHLQDVRPLIGEDLPLGEDLLLDVTTVEVLGDLVQCPEVEMIKLLFGVDPHQGVMREEEAPHLGVTKAGLMEEFGDEVVVGEDLRGVEDPLDVGNLLRDDLEMILHQDVTKDLLTGVVINLLLTETLTKSLLLNPVDSLTTAGQRWPSVSILVKIDRG